MEARRQAGKSGTTDPDTERAVRNMRYGNQDVSQSGATPKDASSVSYTPTPGSGTSTPTTPGSSRKDQPIKEDFAKIKKKLSKAAKVGSVVGALGAHAGKVYDVGNVVSHHDDPGLATATAVRASVIIICATTTGTQRICI